MNKLSLFIIIILCFSSLACADSTEKTQKQELTQEQQKELGKELGIILPNMTKDDVRETFGLVKPKIWFTPEGQEVWHYKVPEEQNIYFKDDKVERVEYTSRKRQKYQPNIKQPEEI